MQGFGERKETYISFCWATTLIMITCFDRWPIANDATWQNCSLWDWVGMSMWDCGSANYGIWKVLGKIFLRCSPHWYWYHWKIVRFCTKYLVTTTKSPELRNVPVCLVWQKPDFDISNNLVWTPQTRVEICRDRHGRNLCKIFASCVNFSRN